MCSRSPDSPHIFAWIRVNWSSVAQSDWNTMYEVRKGLFFEELHRNVTPEIIGWALRVTQVVFSESCLLILSCLQELPSYLCKLGVTFQRGISSSMHHVVDFSLIYWWRLQGFVDLGESATVSWNRHCCAFPSRVFLWGGRGHPHPPPQRGFWGISLHSCQHRHQSQQRQAHQKSASHSTCPVRWIKS